MYVHSFACGQNNAFFGYVLIQILVWMYTRSARTLLSGTHFALMLLSDTDSGLMYTHSARNLLSGTHFDILFRSDTDVGCMSTRSARFLLSDTHFAIVLHSDTGFGLMYTFSAKSAFRCTCRYNASL